MNTFSLQTEMKARNTAYLNEAQAEIAFGENFKEINLDLENA